jgi:hypothetical protein
MRNTFVRVAAITLVSTVALNCGGSTEPLNANLDLARSIWVAGHPQSYSFEFATASFANSNTGYYHVQVANNQVVAASDPTGKPVANLTFTIDTLWTRVLGARDRGELNSASFNSRGVPLESDMGDWALDGGVHYSVRNFTEIH